MYETLHKDHVRNAVLSTPRRPMASMCRQGDQGEQTTGQSGSWEPYREERFFGVIRFSWPRGRDDGLLRNGGDEQHEARPVVQLLKRNRTAVTIYQGTDDGQAESGPPAIPGC